MFDDVPGTAPIPAPPATARMAPPPPPAAPPAPESAPAVAPALEPDLAQQIARLAAIADPTAALVLGQAAIAHFGPAPGLLRYALGAGRTLLELAAAGPPAARDRTRNVAVYVDALLDAALPVAGATAPLFMQVVLALFARRRWGRAANLLETALAASHPAVPQAWMHASLTRARHELALVRESAVPQTRGDQDVPRRT